MKDPNAFLGAYLNIYLMSLGTGVRSDLGNIDAKVNFTAPLPNFGLVALFKPMKWFGIDVSYQEFDIMVVFPNDDIQTTIDYNFRGPAVGLNFMF